mmetsp:Transcript_368/g.1217  ORF Transcript_368/g.1217 Transcript_368/m.1217 type:complete len:217 (-) Transcript_368:1551-2201(-)
MRVVLDDGQIRIKQERTRQRNCRRVVRGDVQQVPLGAQSSLQRHNQTLSQWIDRRISNLGKSLFEVVVEQARSRRDDRNRSVVTHRPRRLDAFLRHGFNNHGNIFGSVTSSGLGLDEGNVVHRRLRQRRARFQAVNVVQPFAIRARRGNFLGNFFVLFERAVFQVDADHRTRTQTSFLNNVRRVGHDIVQNANLRRDINVIIRSLPESRGSQTVSV